LRELKHNEGNVMQLDELQGWIDSHQTAIEGMLRHLVEINTYTANTAGVDHGMDEMCRFADEMGFTAEVVEARHRLIKAGSGSTRPRIMLISHMDTVFPPDGDFLHYEKLDDGYVRGPGTGDIKGGLVMGLWAMKAINELLDDFDVQMIVSANEENGSPTLRDWYMNGHTGADYAIGLEPGFPQGSLSPDVPLGVVYQRRGYCAITFTVHGQSSHSGVPENGLSASEAMAQRIIRIHALNDPVRGVTANVGQVNGGISPNTIPDSMEATVSFRYWTLREGEATLQRVKDIINDRYVYNEALELWDSAELTVEGFLPPMEESERNTILVNMVLEQAERLGQNVVPIARGGGSDANFVSSSGTPTICGMGAPCEGLHTTNERIYLPMLYKRINLLASTMYALITQETGEM